MTDQDIAGPEDTWSASELALRDAFLLGRECDLRSPDPALNKPLGSDAWGPERTVRASVVANLLLREPDSSIAAPSRFVLRGARISGFLDVGCGKVAPFLFSECRFDQAPLLNDAECSFVGFVGSKLPGLSAHRTKCLGAVWLYGTSFLKTVSFEDAEIYDLAANNVDVQSEKFCLCGAHVGHDAVLDHISTAARLCCSRARVGGQFSLMAAKLNGASGVSLDGYLIDVTGSVYLSGEFEAKGTVNLEGAKVGGQLILVSAKIENEKKLALDLDHAEVGLGVMAKGLRVTGLTRMHHARIGCQVNLSGARLENPAGAALRADHLAVEGALMMSDGFESIGSVDIHGAELVCSWTCDDAQFVGAAGRAVNASDLIVRGDIFASRIDLTGRLNLSGAQVSGDLVLSGATLNNPEATTLVLRELQLGGALILNSGFKSNGEVVIANASVKTRLDLRDASIKMHSGSAISAAGISVEGDIVASGLEGYGLVDFASASISGNVKFTDTKLQGLPLRESTYGQPADQVVGGRSRGIALRVSGAEIAGDVDLRGSVLGEALVMRKTRVARNVLLDDVRINAQDVPCLDASGLIADTLRLRLKATPSTGIDLSSARITVLDDSAMSWSTTSMSNIDGLEYGHLGSDQTLVERLRWLHRVNECFRPRSYEQLAIFYAETGNEIEARKVRLEGLRRRHREGRLLQRIWGTLQDGVIGFGYAPGRALAIAVAVWLAGSLVLVYGQPYCGIPPAGTPGLCPIKGDEHPTWDPFLFILDTFIPIVDLGHANAWDPTGWYKGIVILVAVSGWVLVTTIAAAGARLLRRT